MTDIQLTTANSEKSQEKILTCSVYGVHQTESNDISIRFNDKDSEFWCDKNPPQKIKLVNPTTCQLTISTKSSSEIGDYSCTVSLRPQNGEERMSCDLQSQTIPLNEADLCKWPIIITAIVSAVAASVVTAIIMIIIVSIICKCCKKCQRRQQYEEIQ